MTEIRGNKSNAAKRLAKAETKVAAKAEAKRAEEMAEAARLAETKQWIELTAAAIVKEREKMGLNRPPSVERLKAMAKRFHMAVMSDDEYERMYVGLLLGIIDRLDDDSRNQFNIFFADLQKETNG